MVERRVRDRQIELLLAAIALVGVALRVRQYAVGRSLWLDEASLGLNVRDQSFVDLLTDPLPGNQVAPAGFLAAVAVVTRTFGSSDQWLRLVPFLSGVVFVGLAWWFARLHLRTAAAKVVFVASCTWAPVLVYYGSELKQFGTDAMVTLALLGAVEGRHRPHGRPLLIGTGAVGLLLSHTSILVLAGVALVLVVDAWPDRDWRSLLPYGVAWGAVGGLVGLQMLSSRGAQGLDDFWGEGFAPRPTSGAGLEWYWESALGLVHLATRHRGIATQQQLDEWTGLGNVVALLVVVASVVIVARCDPRRLLMPGGTVAAAIGLAAIDVYPFRGRLLIYLVPLVVFVVAVALDEIGPRWPAFASLVTVAAIVPLAVAAVDILTDPEDRFDIVAALERVEADIEPGDFIALGPLSRPAFDFYERDFDLANSTVVEVTDYDADVIAASGGGARVWLVASHVVRDAQERITAMDFSPLVLYRWDGDSVAVRLIGPA
jgi:hypothetical protein